MRNGLSPSVPGVSLPVRGPVSMASAVTLGPLLTAFSPERNRSR